MAHQVSGAELTRAHRALQDSACPGQTTEVDSHAGLFAVPQRVHARSYLERLMSTIQCSSPVTFHEDSLCQVLRAQGLPAFTFAPLDLMVGMICCW